MKVELITSTGRGALAIWAAAKTCKSNLPPIEIFGRWENGEYSGDDIAKLLKALWKAKHYSVFEHASVTFGIEGISRSCLAQLTRHRHLSFSVQSQRYVNMANAEVTIPPSIFDDVVKLEVFGGAIAKMEEVYTELISMGVKQEDARFVLPEGITTNLVLTCNLRAFGELYDKRVKTKGAQWEIVELVDKMADLICDLHPWYRDCLEMM